MRLTTCPRCKQTTPDDMNCYWCNFPDPEKKNKVTRGSNKPLFDDDEEFYD